ncbi:FKBP-type peptidyl-prolyl cis-trans isomerase N-terminal domain-containing protein, partial [Desulfobacula sp.]
MIRVRIILLMFFTTTIFFTQITAFAAEGDIKELTTENDKISYALGFNIGDNIQENYSLNLEAFFQGIKDSKGGSNMLSDEQMQQSLMAFQQQMQQNQVEAMKIKAEQNKEAGKAFLKANKTKEGVKTLASGLQYKVIKNGDGASPKASDTVNCHYKGTTIDGKEFDSSYKRGRPASFQLDAVIKGWSQALLLMKTGSKWMLYIPEDLAYG